MFKKMFRQQCRKCKGTGATSKVAKDNDGNTMLAPIYTKGEAPRPSYEPCTECDFPGSGMQSYDTEKSFAEIMIEGEKVKLEPQEIRSRFNDATA